METMVACSAMAFLKEEESKEEGGSQESSWAKWKRGGIIGAAALTGGTLMAITGGLSFLVVLINPFNMYGLRHEHIFMFFGNFPLVAIFDFWVYLTIVSEQV